MSTIMNSFTSVLLLLLLLVQAPPAAAEETGGTRIPIVIETSMGNIGVELLADEAPVTVANFLALMEADYYVGTLFHRVLPDLIQGGGYTARFERKPRGDEIVNEALQTSPNTRGMVAMVHEPGRPHSATAGFFINLAENGYLDHRNETPRGYGWAVFGAIVEGMEVVDAIAGVRTGSGGPFMRDCPLEPITILAVRRTAE